MLSEGDGEVGTGSGISSVFIGRGECGTWTMVQLFRQLVYYM
jgi:hypothetical protein